MNKILTILFLPIFSLLFTNCKKEKEQEISFNHIRVKMESVKINTSLTGFGYTLNGTIISPKRVDMKEHGFIVKTSGLEIPINLGPASKSGSISAEFSNFTTASIDTSMVTFYIITESGDTITSRGNSILNNPNTPNVPAGNEPSFAWTIPNAVSDVSGNMVFDVFIDIPDNIRYTFVEYGVEYKDSIVYSVNGFAVNFENNNLREFSFPVTNISQQAFITLPNAGYGGNIFTGSKYGAKFYAVFIDNLTGLPIFKSTNSTYFIGPALP